MNKKIIALIVIAIIATSLYFWWFSDSKVIKRNTSSLIECFEKDQDNGRFGGVISTSTLKKLLDDKVHFKFEQTDIPYASLVNNINKDFIVQANSHLVQSPGIVIITNKQIVISDLSSDKAKVNLSFHIKSEKLHTNFNHNFNVKLTYTKKESDWKITEAIISKQ